MQFMCPKSVSEESVVFVVFLQKKISYIFCLQRALLHILCFILCMYGCGQNKKLLHFIDLCSDYCSQEYLATLRLAVLNGNNTIPWKDSTKRNMKKAIEHLKIFILIF